jgi:hypothetical protein
LPEQILLDILHVSYQGTLDSLLSLWTDSTNSEYLFYLNKPAVRLINKKLLLIKYTSEMGRSQRALTFLSYFKANELRNLIFYALVYVLKEIMREKVYEHFLLYAIFIRLLTKKKISEKDLVIAQLIIEEFVQNFANIYGSENMKSNLHAHLHLTEQCKKFGPLNKMSCFPFEGLY